MISTAGCRCPGNGGSSPPATGVHGRARTRGRSRTLSRRRPSTALSTKQLSLLPSLARIALAERARPQSTYRPNSCLERSLRRHDIDTRSPLSCRTCSADPRGLAQRTGRSRKRARLCDYRLRQSELLVTLSGIELAWLDADRALAAAREALDLATAARTCALRRSILAR